MALSVAFEAVTEIQLIRPRLDSLGGSHGITATEDVERLTVHLQRA